ncbi:MAG: hypothetical protein ACTHMV_00805 [Chitinophagaceae bacterium]
MRSFLLQILFALLSCCFFTSATETDIGSYHQTFFDDYDTYMPTEQQALHLADITEAKQKTSVLLWQPVAATFTFSSPITFTSIFPQSADWLAAKKRRLFLYNSSLLI